MLQLSVSSPIRRIHRFLLREYAAISPKAFSGQFNTLIAEEHESFMRKK